MKVQLNPYLTFAGNAREALNFYQECFGGELHIMEVRDVPENEQCPGGQANEVMHGTLSNGTFLLMASDMLNGQPLSPGNDITLSLNFTAEEDIRNTYAKLSEGGRVIDELKVQFWGALFAVVQDKFGKVWMLNCEQQ